MNERTDRELLELAAKAAGIRLEWNGPMELWQPMYYEGKTYHAWDPLLDDGDALRLAVKLQMNVEYCRRWSAARAITNPDNALCEEHMVANRNLNPYAATRRAIVRAAAAMAEGGIDE